MVRYSEPANTNNQRAKGKGKNVSNRNHDYLASSECSFPTTASPRYTKTPENPDTDLMMMIEGFKDINNSLKEMQENTGKQVEDLKEETQKPLK